MHIYVYMYRCIQLYSVALVSQRHPQGATRKAHCAASLKHMRLICRCLFKSLAGGPTAPPARPASGALRLLLKSICASCVAGSL